MRFFGCSDALLFYIVFFDAFLDRFLVDFPPQLDPKNPHGPEGALACQTPSYHSSRTHSSSSPFERSFLQVFVKFLLICTVPGGRDEAVNEAVKLPIPAPGRPRKAPGKAFFRMHVLFLFWITFGIDFCLPRGPVRTLPKAIRWSQNRPKILFRKASKNGSIFASIFSRF